MPLPTVRLMQELDEAFYRAIADAGRGLEALLADGFVYRTSEETLMGKDSLIAWLGSGRTRVRAPRLAHGSTSVQDGTAVSQGEVDLEASAAGTVEIIRARYLHVWVRQGSHWQLAFRESPIVSRQSGRAAHTSREAGR